MEKAAKEALERRWMEETADFARKSGMNMNDDAEETGESSSQAAGGVVKRKENDGAEKRVANKLEGNTGVQGEDSRVREGDNVRKRRVKDLPPEEYVEKLNIEPHAGNCILHTIHYMAKGRSLSEDEIRDTKKKIVSKMQGFPREGYLKDMMKKFPGTTFESFLVMGDKDAVEHFMTQNVGGWLTLVTYLKLLEVSAYVLFKGTILEIGDPREKVDSIYLYVEYDYLCPRDVKHVYGLKPHGEGSELAVLYTHYNVIYAEWEDLNTNGKVEHIMFGVRNGKDLVEYQGYELEQYTWTEVYDWKMGMDSATQSVRKRVTFDNIPTFDTIPEEEITECNLSALLSITRETNKLRDAAEQANLVTPAKGFDVDLQAHDPGGFGPMKTIYQHTNKTRAERQQEPLTSSKSKADLDMHSVNLHENDKVHFKTRVINGDVHHSSTETEKDEEGSDAQGEGEAVYMAKVSVCKQNKETALFDSGATHHIWGQGQILHQLEEGKQVLFDDGEEGWVDDCEMEKCVEGSQTESRRITRITVASGNIMQGRVVPSVDIGVNGRTMLPDGTWEDNKTLVFLKIRNGSACKSIKQTIVAEGQLLRENKDLTLIMHGNEKYMILGKTSFKFEGINGVDPIKIDLRPEGGCHYLDLCTVMMNKEEVKSRFPEDNAHWHEREAARVLGKNIDDARVICVNTVAVTEEACCAEDLTAEDIDEMWKPVKGRIMVAAHDSEPFITEYEANVNCRLTRNEEAESKNEGVECKELMRRTQGIMESREYTEEEKMDALDHLGAALDAAKA